jgi:hypothetical protein
MILSIQSKKRSHKKIFTKNKFKNNEIFPENEIIYINNLLSEEKYLESFGPYPLILKITVERLKNIYGDLNYK